MSKQHLFSDFKPVSTEDWEALIKASLKGAPYESLIRKSPEGITIKPFYNQNDLPESPSGTPKREGADWLICQHLVVREVKEANKKALRCLNSGANALNLHINTPLSAQELQHLLEGILPEHIELVFSGAFAGQELAGLLSDLLKARGLDVAQLGITIHCDPLSYLAANGNWLRNREEDFKALKNIRTAGFSIPVDATLYHNAGANTVQELALALAHAHEYLMSEGVAFAKQIYFHFACGSNYFFEIAKLRAARSLWAFLLEQYEHRAPMHLHCETSCRNKTLYDPHNNILRATAEVMAASLGGANRMTIAPFDAIYKDNSELGERIARNQQLVLKAESYFDKVNDPAAGAYYVESLTNSIAEEAWKLFKTIEGKGGFLQCLENGFIQEMIEASAREQQQRFDKEEELLVGTNRYPNAEEQMTGLIKKAVFSDEADQETLLKPIIPVRLAEKLERKRLNEEKTAADA